MGVEVELEVAPPAPAVRSPWWVGALAGLLGAVIALAVTRIGDRLWASVPSLVRAVAQQVIRRTPGTLAREGIEALRESAKPSVIVGVAVVSLLVGVLTALSCLVIMAANRLGARAA